MTELTSPGPLALPAYLRVENGATTCDDPTHEHASLYDARRCTYDAAHPVKATAPDDLWYILDGTAHRIDRDATSARGGGGVIAQCGKALSFYNVGETPRGREVCQPCEREALAARRPGEDPLYEGEYTTSLDEEVNRFLAEHPMHDREAVRGSLMRARQSDCSHQGRTYTDEGADGRDVLLCGQCDILLMTEQDEDGGTVVSAAE